MRYRLRIEPVLAAVLLAVGQGAMAIDSERPGADMSTPLTLDLHDTSGNTVVAEVVAVERESSGQLVVTFHVTPQTWEHINAEELFHTDRDRRSGAVEGRFEPDRPIAIEATLDDLVVQSLELTNASVDKVRARLNSIQPNTLDQFLLSAQSWLARSVTQEVPLPDELKSKGSISEGFRMERGD